MPGNKVPKEIIKIAKKLYLARAQEKIDVPGNKVPKEIIKIAKKLYLARAQDGKHAYTIGEIVEKIEQSSSRRLARSTICEWAKQYGWDKEFAQAVAKAKAKSLLATSLDTDLDQIQEVLDHGVRFVCALQVKVAEKANHYLQNLKKDDRGMPRAVEAATKANMALMEMLSTAGTTREGEFVVVVESATEQQSLPDTGTSGPDREQTPESKAAALSTPTV